MKNLFLSHQNFSFFSKPLQHRPKVIVLGTGWAGFRFVKGLDHKFWDVIMVSPRNHFIFTPLLASTTVGTLEFRAIIEPTRTICQKYLQAECRKIIPEENKIICYDKFYDRSFEYDYDYLVIGVGSVPNTFNIPGVKENCFFLRTLQDARSIRQRLLTCLEEASSPLCTPETRKQLLSFVVVGGGPTSIEFSAELHDFLVSDFRKWFHDLPEDLLSITVIESTDHILGTFDKKLGEYTEKYFKRNKINIITKARVVEVTKNEIILADGKKLKFGLCVWSTGNRPSNLVQSIDFAAKDRAGRLLVDGHLKVMNTKNIFAIGDCSSQDGYNLPQTAQVAQQEGYYLSCLFRKLQKGELMERLNNFKFKQLGIMSYIGGYQAIVEIGTTKGRGYGAWLFWRSAYFTRLLSIRNKILVPMYWFKAFIFGRDISTF